MPLWGIAVLFVVALGIGLLVFDRIRWVRANAALAERAEALDAWPIGSVRGTGALIFLLHRETTNDATPFLKLEGEQASRISAQDVWTLWQRSRIRWFYTRANKLLGLRQFSWYVDGHRETIPSLIDMSKPAPKWLEVPVLVFCGLVVVILVLAFVFAR